MYIACLSVCIWCACMCVHRHVNASQHAKLRGSWVNAPFLLLSIFLSLSLLIPISSFRIPPSLQPIFQTSLPTTPLISTLIQTCPGLTWRVYDSVWAKLLSLFKLCKVSWNFRLPIITKEIP